MKNVTITMNKEIAKWALNESAKRNTSVSRLVDEMQAQKMASDYSFERAKIEALTFKSCGNSSDSYMARDEIYD
jgi:hypothetical protein